MGRADRQRTLLKQCSQLTVFPYARSGRPRAVVCPADLKVLLLPINLLTLVDLELGILSVTALVTQSSATSPSAG
jgi:hypothetical protein